MRESEKERKEEKNRKREKGRQPLMHLVSAPGMVILFVIRFAANQLSSSSTFFLPFFLFFLLPFSSFFFSFFFAFFSLFFSFSLTPSLSLVFVSSKTAPAKKSLERNRTRNSCHGERNR